MCPYFAVSSVSLVGVNGPFRARSYATIMSYDVWFVVCSAYPSVPCFYRSRGRHLPLRERSDVLFREKDRPGLARGKNKCCDSLALLQILLLRQCWAVEEEGPPLFSVLHPLSATSLVLRLSSGEAWFLAVSTTCWWGRKESLPSPATMLGG